jgi:hypothetical protein
MKFLLLTCALITSCASMKDYEGKCKKGDTESCFLNGLVIAGRSNDAKAQAMIDGCLAGHAPACGMISTDAIRNDKRIIPQAEKICKEKKEVNSCIVYLENKEKDINMAKEICKNNKPLRPNRSGILGDSGVHIDGILCNIYEEQKNNWENICTIGGFKVDRINDIDSVLTMNKVCKY